MNEHNTPTNPAGRAWLASLILSRPKGFVSRLALGLSRLGAMPRGWRRRLRQKAAVSVAGAALILSMAGSAWLAPPAHAATITVNTTTGGMAEDGKCSLPEAIFNANEDNQLYSSTGECATGSGADTITLTTDVKLTEDYGDDGTGLEVKSEIVIEGNGHTISGPNVFEDETISGEFRIFTVLRDDQGDLELRDAVLTGGISEFGGSIYNGGNLSLRGVTVRDALSFFGGGIMHTGYELTLEDSTITHNIGYIYGGGIAAYGDAYGGTFHANVTISDNSRITGNYAYYGGGLFAFYADTTIDGSVISNNAAGDFPEVDSASLDMMSTDGASRGRFISRANQAEERAGRAFLMGRTAASGAMDVRPQDGPPWKGIGGGIYNDYHSTLTIIDSTISGNSAGFGAGGIANFDHTTLSISHSTIANNNGGTRAGGVANFGEMEMFYSTVNGNEAYYGGGMVQLFGSGDIRYSTISFNKALDNPYMDGNGGGIVAACGDLGVRNSTISNNTAQHDGGGVYVAYDYYGFCDQDTNDGSGDNGVSLNHTTIVANTAGNSGGGVIRAAGDSLDDLLRPLAVTGSIISGNTANGVEGVANMTTTDDSLLVDGYNIFGADGDGGIDGFSPDASDIIPVSGVTVADILKPALANNGGPTKTHLLVAGSPALDSDLDENCMLPGNVTMIDQRGLLRNQDADGNPASGSECDRGAVEGIESFGGSDVYVSAKGNGTTGDGVSFDNSDILMWDGSEWTKIFDGSEAELFPKKSKHNVNSFWVGGDEIIMAFAQNGRKVPGIDPKVEGTDLVHWDGSTFTLWFDGSDVGLDKKGPEKIDGLHVLDGDLSPIGGSCINYLLISTQGSGAVPAYGGGQIKFGGEDILGFCMTNQGAATGGFWHVVLDGSAEALPKNIIDSISASEDGQTIYFTTRKNINLGGVTGGPSAVFAFEAGSISGPLFIAADNGLSQTIDGLDMR